MIALFVFYSEFLNLVFSNFYKEELSIFKDHFNTVLSKNDAEIQSISTSDANFRVPVVLSRLRKLDELVNTDTIKIKFAYKSEKGNKVVFFIEGYFGNKDATFSAQLLKVNQDRWLLKTLTLSDHYFFPRLEK